MPHLSKSSVETFFLPKTAMISATSYIRDLVWLQISMHAMHQVFLKCIWNEASNNMATIGLSPTPHLQLLYLQILKIYNRHVHLCSTSTFVNRNRPQKGLQNSHFQHLEALRNLPMSMATRDSQAKLVEYWVHQYWVQYGVQYWVQYWRSKLGSILV